MVIIVRRSMQVSRRMRSKIHPQHVFRIQLEPIQSHSQYCWNDGMHGPICTHLAFLYGQALCGSNPSATTTEPCQPRDSTDELSAF